MAFKKDYGPVAVEYAGTLKGSKILLKGKNGIGKTTLLKAMAGLLHYEGTIKSKKKVCYIGSDITLPKRPLGAYFKQLSPALQGVFWDFFTPKDLALYVSQCSQGMQQKIRLVYGLSFPADLYVCDEPLQGLDAASKTYFITLFKALESDVIVATHLALNETGWTVHQWKKS